MKHAVDRRLVGGGDAQGKPHGNHAYESDEKSRDDAEEECAASDCHHAIVMGTLGGCHWVAAAKETMVDDYLLHVHVSRDRGTPRVPPYNLGYHLRTLRSSQYKSHDSR